MKMKFLKLYTIINVDKNVDFKSIELIKKEFEKYCIENNMKAETKICGYDCYCKDKEKGNK